MRIDSNNLRPLTVLLVALGSMWAWRLPAQTLTILHNFTDSDGAVPFGTVVLSGDTLYGTANQGGSWDSGTVFKMNVDGSGFTPLHQFTATTFVTNLDGAGPRGLMLSSNTLYGITGGGGLWGTGTIFKMNIDGSEFTNLYSFTSTSAPDPNDGTNSDGALPSGTLIASGNILYGTTQKGGDSGSGTVFKINCDGTNFTTLYSFTAVSDFPAYTNRDGADPEAGLVLSNATLYGTAPSGGTFGLGTVFAVNTDGTGFTNLHNFNLTEGGGHPLARLVLSGSRLYGTAYGELAGYGAIFGIDTDGGAFSNLYTFSGFTDGGYPRGGLCVASNTLFGFASGGGDFPGAAFRVNTDGADFEVIYTFPLPSLPDSDLILSDQILYGPSEWGGAFGAGMVFSLSFPVQLGIAQCLTKVILTWPAGAPGFTSPISYEGFNLESTTNLQSPTWSTVSATRFLTDGQYLVTNLISSPQQFFRLGQ